VQNMPHQADSVDGQRRQNVVIARHQIGDIAKSELTFGEVEPGSEVLRPETG
jgi:hypothetical protein